MLGVPLRAFRLVTALLGAAAGFGCGGQPSVSTASPDASAPNPEAGAANPDAGPVTLPWLSGTRLRARIWTDGEGAQLFRGWWDNLLALPCTFRQAADHKLRCMPDLQLGAYSPPDDCSQSTWVMGDARTTSGTFF